MARSLAALRPQESGRIAALGGDLATSQRLRDLGLTSGTRIEVVRSAPLGDPIELRVRGVMLTLRRADAEHVLVD